MTNRTLVSICLVVLILAFPYWIYVPVVVGAIFYFPFYYEAVIYGFLIDTLYGKVTYSLLTFKYPFAVGFFCLILLLLPLRRYIRVQNV